MMYHLAFYLIDWQNFRPENWFGGQILERTPAGLSLVYLCGIAVLILILLLSFLRNRRIKFAYEQKLPKEVRQRLSSTATNRSLRIWQVVFVLLAVFVYGFHLYWAVFAERDNQRFQELGTRDLRYRRSTSSQLRGWMFDRSGKLEKALAYYKKTPDGTLARAYGLDREMSQLLGTEIGSPGLERTLYKHIADPLPEAWEILTKIKKPEDAQKDARITIDYDLQKYAGEQIKAGGFKRGAIVVLNPQTGDVLAMYSDPTFLLSEVKDNDDMHRLEMNKMDKPLLSRSLREFYVPGSTFKTFTTIAAFRANKQDALLPDIASCYVPFPNSRPICDAGGSCEICSPSVPIREAYKVSSNQYFAELANLLGRDRMKETAEKVGITGVETPGEALTQGYFPEIWNVSNKRIAGAISPIRSTIVTGSKLSLYDTGLEGMGQGLAGQMTPFQMALIASIPANLQGNMMKPRIEFDQPPQIFSNLLTPQQAATIREIMSTVTEEAGGTGGVVRSKLAGTGINTGGKTGTAEKLAPVYNPDGTLKTVTKRRRVNGEWVQYQAPSMVERTDGWFICIAPLENPQIAIAVVVEDIGHRFGGGTAAPIAANMILKARELGLLGDKYKPAANTPTGPKKRGR